ncbi:MAG: GNAT family N-acetyltransferase [Rhizobiales bacterium]|nr:GNAT family N-acetyltransferase [Hyphomicrobiales bacterium]
MQVSIRPTTAADIPAITRIYADAVQHGTASFELEPPDEAEMLRRRGALVDGGFPYIVGERGGVILGYAYVGPFRPRPAYRYSVEDSVYVAPDAHGRGIGRTLLEALIVRCTEAGFRQMIAVIGDSTLQAASIALHTAAGFRLIGTLDAVGYKHGRWLDSVYMQRPLGAGAASLPEGMIPKRPART